MKIAILGAMDEEVELLKSSLNNVSQQQVKHLTFYSGQLHGLDIVLCKCGIGKVAAAVATTVIVEKFEPDCVVNTGSAGGFDKDLDIGDLVIANEVLQHDVDVTHFGYQPGQPAGMPAATFKCDSQLIEAAQQAVANLAQQNSKLGLVCSGDGFIGSDEVAQHLSARFPTMAAVEMEGAAIGQACFLMGIPFLVIRSLSDIAGKTSTVSFQEYLPKAAKHSALLVMEMVSALSRAN